MWQQQITGHRRFVRIDVIPFKDIGENVIFTNLNETIGQRMLWENQKCPIQEVAHLFAQLKKAKKNISRHLFGSKFSLDLRHFRQECQTE